VIPLYAYLQAGELQGLRTVKRVRVAPYSSAPVYASAVEQPVELSHRVPAVSTYKVAAPYSPQPQQGGFYVPRRVEGASRPLLKVQNPKGEQELPDEYPSDVRELISMMV